MFQKGNGEYALFTSRTEVGATYIPSGTGCYVVTRGVQFVGVVVTAYGLVLIQEAEMQRDSLLRSVRPPPYAITTLRHAHQFVTPKKKTQRRYAACKPSVRHAVFFGLIYTYLHSDNTITFV